ncbi:dihydrofolate reductase family protein [Saxibacter everestensis]|uniref:Dihydrofolate reductase family protein n=1 Tax=Saxibacter everestensis TaxID=2909229 RepID=A0ABY8QS20_9MICO|nr:dihydrofolate reductase family protein [Brevibacteriaceae bacterium ZFBP1038]
MTAVTCDIAISLDGFVAGPNQSLEAPLGEGAEDRLHRWMFEQPEGNEAELKAITSAGAYIMGRNMFSPGRGEWDQGWRGWWGDDPPYHAPVFVLTHHARDPLPMQGGTTFNFITDGIDSALQKARDAADGKDVAIAGGAATINQFLAAGLIDELRLHLAPVTLGAGERLFEGIGSTDYEQITARQTDIVTHLTYRPVR